MTVSWLLREKKNPLFLFKHAFYLSSQEKDSFHCLLIFCMADYEIAGQDESAVQTSLFRQRCVFATGSTYGQ